MTPGEEAAYARGEKAIFRRMFADALRGLGRPVMPDSVEALTARVMQLEQQRAFTVAALRIVCAEHGDNDWEDGDYLADVVEKHLGRYLDSKRADR